MQNAEGKRGTSSSLCNLRTRQSDIDAIRAKLRARCEKLREEIAAFEAEKVEKEKQRQELDKSYEKLNQEKNDILKEQQKNRGEIDVKITSILGIIISIARDELERIESKDENDASLTEENKDAG